MDIDEELTKILLQGRVERVIEMIDELVDDLIDCHAQQRSNIAEVLAKDPSLAKVVILELALRINVLEEELEK